MINSLLRMPTNTYCVHHHMNQNEKKTLGEKKPLEKVSKKMYFISQKQTLILFFQVFTYLSILRHLYMPADTALELQVGADDISTAQK